MKIVKNQTWNRTVWNLEAFVCDQTKSNYFKNLTAESLNSEMTVLLIILYGSSTELALSAIPRIGLDNKYCWWQWNSDTVGDFVFKYYWK